MSQIVKCHVCGKLFNERYVSSHKRLAHDEKQKPDVKGLSEPEMVEQILALYDRLSAEKRKELRSQLGTKLAMSA